MARTLGGGWWRLVTRLAQMMGVHHPNRFFLKKIRKKGPSGRGFQKCSHHGVPAIFVAVT